MVYAYYPGCTLHQQAAGFRESTARSAQALGIELAEMPTWQCCGAVYPLAKDNLFGVVSAARNLAAAHDLGQAMVTVCSACYHVHKRTNRLIATDQDARAKLDAYIETEYDGSGEVLHLLEVIRRDIGFDALRERVKVPLLGLKVAGYYGCLLLRPQEELEFDDPEAPRILEELIEGLGAQAVTFSHRVECCGQYLSLSNPAAAHRCSGAVLRSARRAGAEVVVTSCPLCFFNLDEAQAELAREDPEFQPLPVLYFTQLLALALGVWERPWLSAEHQVDPAPVLSRFKLPVAEPAGNGE